MNISIQHSRSAAQVTGPIIEIGRNDWGWYVSVWGIGWRVRYLHPDGQWRKSMQMNDRKLGYFNSEEEAHAALNRSGDLLRSTVVSEEEEEEISIWEGI